MNARCIYSTSTDNVLNRDCNPIQPLRYAKKSIQPNYDKYQKQCPFSARRTSVNTKKNQSHFDSNKVINQESPKGKMRRDSSFSHRDPILCPDDSNMKAKKKTYPIQKTTLQFHENLMRQNMKRLESIKLHNKSSIFEDNNGQRKSMHHTFYDNSGYSMKGLLSYQAVKLF